MVIGFDAREPLLRQRLDWSEERRQHHLLRLDAECVASVDDLVWRSLFDVERALRRPEWTGPVQCLWEDLATLRAVVTRRVGRRWQELVFVAVTVEAGGLTPELAAAWDERVGVAGVSPMGDTWRLLGFDVADYYLLSALSNCGYAESEVGSLRAGWASRLNRLHLFERRDDAIEFARLSGERVPEHAPFMVFGLLEIETPPLHELPVNQLLGGLVPEGPDHG